MDYKWGWTLLSICGIVGVVYIASSGVMLYKYIPKYEVAVKKNPEVSCRTEARDFIAKHENDLQKQEEDNIYKFCRDNEFLKVAGGMGIFAGVLIITAGVAIYKHCWRVAVCLLGGSFLLALVAFLLPFGMRNVEDEDPVDLCKDASEEFEIEVLLQQEEQNGETTALSTTTTTTTGSSLLVNNITITSSTNQTNTSTSSGITNTTTTGVPRGKRHLPLNPCQNSTKFQKIESNRGGVKSEPTWQSERVSELKELSKGYLENETSWTRLSEDDEEPESTERDLVRKKRSGGQTLPSEFHSLEYRNATPIADEEKPGLYVCWKGGYKAFHAMPLALRKEDDKDELTGMFLAAIFFFSCSVVIILFTLIGTAATTFFYVTHPHHKIYHDEEDDDEDDDVELSFEHASRLRGKGQQQNLSRPPEKGRRGKPLEKSREKDGKDQDQDSMTASQKQPVTLASMKKEKFKKFTSAQKQPITTSPTQKEPTTIASAQIQPTKMDSAQAQPTTMAPAQAQPTTMGAAQAQPTTMTTAQTQPTTMAPAQTQRNPPVKKLPVSKI